MHKTRTNYFSAFSKVSGSGTKGKLSEGCFYKENNVFAGGE
jgi:hypothetical protein